ncbi:unnamed protein product [Miscanthus lutarioriparius]|uniref:Uncharacterized protein n=1 Tax=Miscanthus lutarioriparius TaxID=422564 RepID=A0A811SIP7_9POAL|nr:unnamed protein product [Miscanthus lutarioriparius]
MSPAARSLPSPPLKSRSIPSNHAPSLPHARTQAAAASPTFPPPPHAFVHTSAVPLRASPARQGHLAASRRGVSSLLACLLARPSRNYTDLRSARCDKGRNYHENGRAAVPRGAGGEALRHALRQHRPTGPLLLRVRHLAALAVDLDQRERLVMLEGCRSPGASNAATGDFFTVGEGSHKVSSTVISASRSLLGIEGIFARALLFGSRRLPQVDMDDAHQVSKRLLKCPQEVEFFFSEVTMYMSLWILRELHAHLITQPRLTRLWGSSCLLRPNWATMLTRSSSRQARDIADQGSNPEGEITVQKCEEFLSQASSISDEDYEDFLVTISESMAKKITDQETYLKVFVFLGGLSRTIGQSFYNHLSL